MTTDNNTFKNRKKISDVILKKYNFIVFDLDDTIISSQIFHIQTYLDVMRQMGITITHDDVQIFKDNIHSGAGNALRSIGIDERIAEDIQTEKRSLFKENKTIHKLPMYPRTGALIKQIHSLNIPMGVITNSSDENTFGPLNNHDLINYFEIVHTRDTNDILKPDVQKAKEFEKHTYPAT